MYIYEIVNFRLINMFIEATFQRFCQIYEMSHMCDNNVICAPVK